MRFKDVMEEKLYAVKPDKVIIAAALKHIDTCELNVGECIRTNVSGIQNVVDVIAHISNMGGLPNLNTVCFVSTDKATSPVNVYGMSKALAERVVVEKSLTIQNPKFVIVRYGNVLNSRGSLLPLFHKIGRDDERKFFGVTHPEMTRFFMRLEDAIQLIEEAMEYGESGDTFVPTVKAYRIMDIAERFSKIYNKPIKIIGIRPGEKLHECLINQLERRRTIKEGDTAVIKPCYRNDVAPVVDFEFEYTSDIALGDEDDLDELITEMNEL
jgi:UDP-glucose 4-epimerase